MKLTQQNNQPLDCFEKGSGDLASLPEQGWNILAEEVSLPIAVLNERAIDNNAQWMSDFSKKADVKLAPHGKTSMAIDLFKTQLDHGCWGMSLATVPQVVNAYNQGIKRIIMANQLVGKFHCQQIAELLGDQTFEFYCFVDSIENVNFLGEYFADKNVTLKILLEIGVSGGRCGWRDLSTINQLIKTVAQYQNLTIAGISFYEGVIHGDNAEQKITDFIEQIKQLFSQLKSQQVFKQTDVIITGAGSAWYDVVAKVLTQHNDELNYIPVIRPGCYLIHDTGIYQDAQQIIMERSQLACDIRGELGGDLVSSLTVWAYVYSVPEPGLAIIGFGKRDAAFDAGLPTPELFYRPGDKAPEQVNGNWQLTKMMDQHCMMTIGEADDIKVGDMISFSTSHPCLTMDKWRKIALINDDYCVTKQIATYF